MTPGTICLMCTAAAKNFAGLLVCRMFLGAFEATILPSFIFITQMWWIRREQSYRSVAYMVSIDLWHRHTLIRLQIANSFAGILGPLLSYGVGRAVDTSSHPPIFEYQGIFLFLGGISFCFVPIVWALLPNSPTTARFLKHGNDRLIAIDRLRANNTGTKERFCLDAANWAPADGAFRLPGSSGISFGRRSATPRHTCGRACGSAPASPLAELVSLGA
jgi:MFS family permease